MQCNQRVYDINALFILVLLHLCSANAFSRVTVKRALGCTSIARCKGIDKDLEISVYDEVLVNEIVETADVHARAGGLGHSCMDRGDLIPRTAVEAAIDLCLKALGDTSRYVEYWWREEWICLDAHRDIDELLARDEDDSSTLKEKMRYPINAHVFYLDVGEEVCGPTILFHEDKNEEKDSSLSCCTVVHAKKNRLVKMRGDILHAVPRPELCYFNPDVGGSNTMIWTRTKREKVPQSERRSVLLFNTWETAPYSVSFEPPDGSLKAAKEDATTSGVETEKWLHSVGHLQSLHIEDKTNIVEETTRMKVGLLGDAVRRGRTDRYLDLQCDIRLLNAFSDKEKHVATYRLFET